MGLLNDMYDMCYDEVLQRRCTSACAVKARQILGEIDTTPNHKSRLGWATATLKNPDAETKKLMWSFAQDPALAAAQSSEAIAAGTVASDEVIQTTVNTVVDAVIVDPPPEPVTVNHPFTAVEHNPG